MPVSIPRGKADAEVESIAGALGKYQADHPEATIDVYRQSPYCIRIRIIDNDFKGQPHHERHATVWTYLDELDEDAQSDISMLLLLTPDEAPTSMGSMEFDDPVPSGL